MHVTGAVVYTLGFVCILLRMQLMLPGDAVAHATDVVAHATVVIVHFADVFAHATYLVSCFLDLREVNLEVHKMRFSS